MRILISVLVCLFTFTNAIAYEYSPKILDIVKEGQKTAFCAETKKWSREAGEKDIVFTKFITHGSGSFSEYRNDNTYYDTNTTYEFLYKDRLFGYNMHQLKFYELKFENDKFKYYELSPEIVQQFFPNVEIIKVSEFKDNRLTLKKPRFKKVTYLLLNDTKKDFYKYQFENIDNEKELVHGIFEIGKIKKPMTLVYSHFGSRDEAFPVLRITVKNNLF